MCNMESLAPGNSAEGKMWREGQNFMSFFQQNLEVVHLSLLILG